jgi:hypothetical protein
LAGELETAGFDFLRSYPIVDGFDVLSAAFDVLGGYLDWIGARPGVLGNFGFNSKVVDFLVF